MCLQSRFVIFCLKEIGAKAARKMLVIMTVGLNFINILKVAFFEQKCFDKKVFVFFGKRKLGEGALRKMLLKLTPDV